jgi:hypothetical protein
MAAPKGTMPPNAGKGRRAGIPNKRTQAVADLLAEMECDPIAGMAQIALDANNPIELRAMMYAELAQYVAPKRRAVEHSGDVNLIEQILLEAGS